MSTIAEILNLLRAEGKTISTAESITTGYLQSMLASVSGASDVFKGGITAYTLPVKVELLNVDEVLAKKTNCIEEEIACQMAQGALKLFKTDYAIATCGYAEIDEGNPYAFFAIAEAPTSILYSNRIELHGDRIAAQKQTAKHALEKLHKLLQSLPSG